MNDSTPLFIFEMANNHQGSVTHGKNIIRAMGEAAAPFAGRFRFAVKFQYRDLDTFIHPAAREQSGVKHVQRFLQTRLSMEQFAELLACARERNMLAVCTPFDEISAARVKEQGFDFIKIASCSFGDWPLMEAVAETRLPVIASAAGSDMDTVRKVAQFFGNRNLPLTLMHCVGEYPTPDERLQMNQIDLYRREFPHLTIGFSTHEAPDNLEPVKIAVAKGARVFEKHVGLPTETIVLNAYSANPAQVRAWLDAADAAFALCGVENARYAPGDKEAADLASLRRGAFIRADGMKSGDPVTQQDVYFAFPCVPGQVLAQDFSKYTRIQLHKDAPKDAPLMRDGVTIDTERQRMVASYVSKIVDLLKDSNAVVPVGSSCELSHHYGLEKFEETGLTLIDCVNREYCKKLLVLLPGQSHPIHHHVRKEETFIVLHGDLTVHGDGTARTIRKGDTMTMERLTPHGFSSENGCVFEEISSTHCSDDSFYRDRETFVHPRKTTIYLTKDVLPW